MKGAGIIGVVLGVALLAGSALAVQGEITAANERLKKGPDPSAPKPAVAVADDAELAYCTPAFKQVLQRTLNACGLIGQDARRGCQPADVKTLAAISDEDFNALFTPLKDRGAVIQFDDGSDKLDDDGKKIIEELWQDRRGARYFFIIVIVAG